MLTSYWRIIILIPSFVISNENGGNSLKVPSSNMHSYSDGPYFTMTESFKYESNSLFTSTNEFYEQTPSACLSRLSLRGGGKKSTSRRKTRSIHNWKAKHKRPGENPLQEYIFTHLFEIKVFVTNLMRAGEQSTPNAQEGKGPAKGQAEIRQCSGLRAYASACIRCNRLLLFSIPNLMNRTSPDLGTRVALRTRSHRHPNGTLQRLSYSSNSHHLHIDPSCIGASHCRGYARPRISRHAHAPALAPA
jgi:hypothetical protein